MPEPENIAYQYDAFLSYSTKGDKETAWKVEAFLESFHRKERAQDGSRIRQMHICRDGSDFKAKRPEEVGSGQDDLWGIMRTELSKCRYLIVLCSPDAVKSTWMSKEISWFLEHRGRGWILPVVIAGHDPHTKPEECFPTELITAGLHTARIWYDLRGLAKDRTQELPYDVKNPDEQSDRLASDLLPWDEAQYGPRPAPWVREQRRKQQQRKKFAIVSIILILCAVIVGPYWQKVLRSRDLAEKAISLLEQKPDVGLLLAIKAMDVAAIPQSRLAFFKAIFKNSFLFNPSHPFSGHTNSVESATFSSDGTRVLTTSWDKTAYVWDAVTGRSLAVLRHPDDFRMAEWSPDSAYVVTVGTDGTIRAWDVATGRNIVETQKTKTEDERYYILKAVLTQDRQHVIIIDNKAIRIWDWRAGQMVREIEIKGRRIGDVASVSSDSSLFGTIDNGGGSWPGIVYIWDAKSGQIVSELRHEARVVAVSFSPDNALVATGDDKDTVRIWEAGSGRRTIELKANSDDRPHAIFSSDGTRIVTFNEYGRVSADAPRIWDTRTGREITLLKGHKEGEAIRSATFSHDGTRIMAAGYETVRIYDASNGRQLLELQGVHPSFSPDEKRIVTILGNTARIWDAASGKPLLKLGSLAKDKSNAVSVAFSPDGRHAAIGNGDGTARIWDMDSAQWIVELKGHTGAVRSVSFSPDGKKIATAGADGTLRIRDATSDESLVVLNEDAEVESVAFSPDGTLIVTVSQGGARVWKAHGPDSPLVLHLDSKVASAVFSPDGRVIATAERDGVAKIWDVKSGKPIQDLERDDAESLTNIVYTADGTRVLTGSANGRVRIWDVKSGKMLKELSNRYKQLRKAFFSPNGRQIVTVSNGPLPSDSLSRDEDAWLKVASLRIWDAESGQPLGRLGANIYDAAMSPDGRTILVADLYGNGYDQPHVYTCEICGSVDELLALAKQRAPRDFTPEERIQFGL
jgi:WD40 repeat protein